MAKSFHFHRTTFFEIVVLERFLFQWMLHHDSIGLVKFARSVCYQSPEQFANDVTIQKKSRFRWEIQDPKMEVHKRTIFLAIFSGDIP